MRFLVFVSLHIRSMWETTVMRKQVSGCTVNFGPNFPESPFLESQTRKPPPPPISENFRFGMTKVYFRIPPLPHFRKLQIWDDQSLLRNTPPPILENFRFGMTKVYSRIPTPPPFQKTSDLGWPKFTSEYPPNISENFRFGMTKVYSRIPPPEGLRMPRVTTCGDFIQPG